MKKTYALAGAFVVALGVSVSSWADEECRPIAQACMKAGYYKGGSKEGKGLIKDCVLPVVSKSMTLPGTQFNDMMLEKCKMQIMSKMSQMKSKAQ